jgi:isopropylmalate/homocitrate/citramalate synthase
VFNEFRRLRPPRGAAAQVTERAPAPEPRPPAPELPPSVVISDTTLRDGEQAPGVAFDAQEKIRIATRLAALGVPLIEAGFPAVSPEEAEAVRGVVAAELDAVIQVIARPVRRDIDLAVGTGAQSIALFIGTSDAHLARKLRTDRPHLVRQVGEAVGYAKNSGRQVVFCAEDATRTDPDFLTAVCAVAAESGADAVGLADTVGVATPWSFMRLVQQVTAGCRLPVAVHCHNDLGLATANSLAALLGGASGVQCSVLGIGERAGNACLEELVLALEVGLDHRTGLDLTGLGDLAHDVAAVTGQSVMPGRPVVGRNAFLHESGLHTSGIVRDPTTYEPYPPELVGRTRAFAAGKHSGRSGIGHILSRHGVTLADDQMDALLTRVKSRRYHGDPLDERELLRLARQDDRTPARRRP